MISTKVEIYIYPDSRIHENDHSAHGNDGYATRVMALPPSLVARLCSSLSLRLRLLLTIQLVNLSLIVIFFLDALCVLIQFIIF